MIDTLLKFEEIDKSKRVIKTLIKNTENLYIIDALA